MAAPEPEKPPDKVSDNQENVTEPMEDEASSSDTASTAVVQSYAAAVTNAETENEKIVDVLRIVLKKTKTGASYHLKPKEKAKLVFIRLGIPRNHVVGIDQADFRTVLVHLNCPAGPWRIAHSIEVRDGLITLPMRMFRRLTKVRVMGVGVQTNDMEVVDMLKHFGTFEDTFQGRETRYYEHADMSKLTMEEKMLKGVKESRMGTGRSRCTSAELFLVSAFLRMGGESGSGIQLSLCPVPSRYSRLLGRRQRCQV